MIGLLWKRGHSMNQAAQIILQEIGKVVIGKDKVMGKMLMAILAQGHILLEDSPGVGKTTIALAFSKVLDLQHKRIQFTPEVMPADVVGYSMYNKATGRLEYQPGAVLCSLLLADELNRASSKTQSALLEAMEEGQVTVDGETHPLPQPFTVIATQNPIGSAGTQLLPESQVDRFMIRISIGYPKPEDEVIILKQKKGQNPLDEINQLVDREALLKIQQQVESIHIDEDLYRYIARLAAATRDHPSIKLGISPRGSIALMKMACASAWVAGRDYMIPLDIKQVIYDVWGHRLILAQQARGGEEPEQQLLDKILKSVPEPRLI